MMFAMRGIAVSFSIFVMLYSALSVAVCGVWRSVWLASQRHSARRRADLLFALRLLPFVVATGLTLVLAVPSFLLLEPRAVNEPMGACARVAGPLWGHRTADGSVEGGCGVAAGFANRSAMVERCARLVSSRAIDSPASVSVRVSAAAPPLTAAGILRPSVWLSQDAELVLSEREFESALRHEVTHVRRRDNLRKLILRLVAFPGMAELERAWREATEMAADDAAVSSAAEALDLAAALIKLSRLAPLEPPAELTTALVHSPAESVNARVERLIAWTEQRQSPAPGYSLVYPLCTAAAVVVTLAVTYSHLLVRVHAATEWLVR